MAEKIGRKLKNGAALEWSWATDSRDGVVLVAPGGYRISPGRIIVAQADEARKGEFALIDVLEELEQARARSEA